MSLKALIKGTRGKSGFGYASTAEEVTEGIDMHGKVVLITGANSGLGNESARVLAKRGATIIAVARSNEKATAAAAAWPGAIPVACDLSEPSSVRACAAAVKELQIKIDVLICNAGIMALPTLEQCDGYELQFYTNHIGHFILVNELLAVLSDDARVVVLSSYGHQMASRGVELDNLSGEKDYSAWRAYGRSKLCNLLFVKSLARKFEGTRKTANAVHPGVIRTNLGRHLNPALKFLYAATDVLYSKNVQQGASTTCFVAAHPSVQDVSGKYFSDCNELKPSTNARNVEMADALWAASEEVAAKSA